METRKINLYQINMAMAKIDSGLLPEDCRRLIQSCYKNRPGIKWDSQLLDFMVMEYTKDSKEPSLFLIYEHSKT